MVESVLGETVESVGYARAYPQVQQRVLDHTVPFPPAAHRLGESANWVVGVINDPLAAWSAQQAAGRAGVAEHDVILLSGQEALAVVGAKEARMNPLMRVYAAACRVLTDPGCAESEYRQEAALGHSLVSIRATSDEEVARAGQLLVEYGAHRVKHFGTWLLTDLVP